MEMLIAPRNPIEWLLQRLCLLIPGQMCIMTL